jgi:hypothetical protein
MGPVGDISGPCVVSKRSPEADIELSCVNDGRLLSALIYMMVEFPTMLCGAAPLRLVIRRDRYIPDFSAGMSPLSSIAEISSSLQHRSRTINRRWFAGDPVTVPKCPGVNVEIVYALANKPEHCLGEDETDVLLQPLAQSVAPVGVTVGIAGLWTHPHDAVAYLDCRRRNVVGPKVKGAATGQVKAGMMPMAGQDAVFDRASMERKSKMRATVIEGEHLPVIIDDEQPTASTANNDHTRGLQLLQRRHANEVGGAGGKLFADPYFRHVVQWSQRPRR